MLLPDGNGPKKSIAKSCHGPWGSFVRESSSGLSGKPTSWQP